MSENNLEKILIIDDSADYRKLIKTFVNKLLPEIELIEYDPVFQGVPDETFDWSQYDVLLLDYHLSIVGVTGLDILQKNHRKPEFPATIMLTGAGTEEVAIRALKTGIYKYQSKQALTKDKLKQFIIHAWETKKEQRVKQQELTQQNRAFNKELFYEKLKQASENPDAQRVLMVLQPDNIAELEKHIGIIGRDNLLNFIGKKCFEVFKLGACNPNITRISDVAIGMQIDFPDTWYTLEHNMQGLCKHLTKSIFSFSDEVYEYSISMGIIKLGEMIASPQQLIEIATEAARRASTDPANSYYIWKEDDVYEPEQAAAEETADDTGVIDEEKERIKQEVEAAKQEKQRLEKELKEAEAAQAKIESNIKAEQAEAQKNLQQQLAEIAEMKARAQQELEAASAAKVKAEEEAKKIAEQEKQQQKTEAEKRQKAEAVKRAAEQEKKQLEEELRLKAETEAKLQAETEAKARAEAEIRARQEEQLRREAELKAEAEAKAKAELEERLKAEEEARARAEAEKLADQEAQKRREAEIRAEAEAKAKAELEERLKAETEAKAKAEAEKHAEQEALQLREEEIRAEAEAKAKAELEEKLKAEEEARARAAAEKQAEQEAQQRRKEELRVKAEAKAKAELEAEMNAARAAREQMEAELKAISEAKAKAEAEMNEVREAKAKLQSEIHTAASKPAATPEQNKTGEPEAAGSASEPPATTAAPEKSAKSSVAAVTDEQTELSTEESADSVDIEATIQQLLSENRIIQTYQPVVAMFEDEAQEEDIEVYKTGLLTYDDTDDVNSRLADTSGFSLELQQSLNEWMLRQIFARITESGTENTPYRFIIDVTESWFTDIKLFQWLQKILTQTKKYNPGKAIVINVSLPVYQKHEKRAAALINTLHKTHNFHVALHDIDDIENTHELCTSLFAKLLIMDMAQIQKLSATLAPSDTSETKKAENEETDESEQEQTNLLQYLKENGIRVATTGIEDATLLTDAITAGTDYAIGEFVGGVQESVSESTSLESFELT